MLNAYLFLFGAIVAECVGSIGLKFSDGMTKLGPSAVVIVAYGISFWLFALALRVLPLGMTSAIWAGMGIVCSVIGGIVLFNERVGWVELTGMLLILSGTTMLMVLSKAAHN